MVAKVSVLMPVYNTDGNILRQTIESILSQTFTDFEFLIVNDCSTDENVEKIVLEYQQKDNRIKYFMNEKNLGISGTRNKLIDLSQGEYLAVMDHDDISLPNRFEKQVEFLDKNLDVGVVASWYEEFPKTKIVKYPTNDFDIKVNLMQNCALLHPASMIRKSVLTRNNLKYEADFSPAEDYCLWIRLIKLTKFANIPEILFKYRVHGNNESIKQNTKMLNRTYFINKIIKKELPDLLELSNNILGTTKYIKLFKIIPFLKITERYNIKEYKLFNCLTILSIKHKGIK